MSYYETDLHSLIAQIFHNELTEDAAQGITKNIDNYPAIRSALRANVYLFFIQLVQRVVPATDKVDDHRHVIEASYCNVFFTKDRQLLSNVTKINPDLKPMSWDDI